MSEAKDDSSVPIKFRARVGEEEMITLCSQCIKLQPWAQACEIFVRPDCKEESILGIVENVLMSLGGSISKSFPSGKAVSGSNLSRLATVSCSNSSENQSWNSITAVLGVTAQFRRVVIVIVSGPVAATIFSRRPVEEEQSFGNDLIKYLFSTLQSASMIEQPVMDLSPLTDHLPDSVIDVSYVRDLQSAVAQEMDNRLMQEVNKVDLGMKEFELKCARTMTLLKQTYTRADLALPDAPAKISLNAYQLTLKRPSSIRDIDLEGSKALLLRARRKYREFMHNFKAHGRGQSRLMLTLLDVDFSNDDFDKYGFQVAFLGNELRQSLVAWSDEEFNCRLRRKLAATKDRYEALRRFRMQLLLTLHDRFASSPAPAANPATFLSAFGFSGISADRKLQAIVQERFPFIKESEPVLVETTANTDGNKANIYITLGHLLSFAPNILPNGTPTLAVIPFKTLDSVQLMLSGVPIATVFAGAGGQQVQGDLAHARSVADSVQPSTGFYTVRVVDLSGVAHELRFLEVTPDYALRIFDLFGFMLKDKLFIAAEYRPAHRPTVESTESISLQDLGEMLEITFGDAENTPTAPPTVQSEDFEVRASVESKPAAEIVAASSVSQPQPPAESALLSFDDFTDSSTSPHTPATAPASVLPEFMDLLVPVSAPPATLAQQPMNAASIPAPPVATSQPPPKDRRALGSNIQKFLQQNQKKDG